MRISNGLDVIQKCFSSPHHEERLFRNLSPSAAKLLQAITSDSAYPKGAVLFVEGQTSHGIFVVCKGRVRLSASSTDDNVSRIADPGEVLGLVATVSGKPYNVTADAVEPVQANFIGCADFLDFLREHGEAALRVCEQLSEDYRLVLSEARTIGLFRPAAEKLTRFLMDLTAGHLEEKDELHLKLTLTHEEIAQIIGVSRETVTRLLADFEEKQFIEIKGSTLVIRNRAALENLAGRLMSWPFPCS
jgi:CRP/FNR family transcriptional regulator